MVNESWIRSHKIGIGSIIEVTKANQIIPQFVRNLEQKTPEEVVECPGCGGPVHFDGTNLFCTKNCQSDLFRIYGFLNTHAQKLGYSTSTIDKILSVNGITSFDQMIEKLGFLSSDGLTDHEKIYLEFLNQSFSRPLIIQNLLVSLNIPGVGLTWSKKFAHDVIPYLEGKKSVDYVFDHVLESVNRYRDLILRVYRRFSWRDQEETADRKLNVTITGKLSMTKEEFCKKYNLVQVPLDKSKLLICADKSSNSNKMKEARARNFLILSEEEFLEKFLGGFFSSETFSY